MRETAAILFIEDVAEITKMRNTITIKIREDANMVQITRKIDFERFLQDQITNKTRTTTVELTVVENTIAETPTIESLGLMQIRKRVRQPSEKEINHKAVQIIGNGTDHVAGIIIAVQE